MTNEWVGLAERWGPFIALATLTLYMLRVSNAREAELVRHKEKLVSLLECYGKQLTEMTQRIADLALSQSKIEERLERMDERMWNRGQPITLSQSQIGERASVGQQGVGSGHTQTQPANAVNSAGTRVGGE